MNSTYANIQLIIYSVNIRLIKENHKIIRKSFEVHN